MALRTEVITYGDFQAPAGTVVVSVVLTYTDATGNHQGSTIPAGTQPAPVTLDPGVWTATAQAVDAAGNAVGPVATDTFTIEVPATITVSIPTALSGTTS
jgi:hypothetical protein